MLKVDSANSAKSRFGSPISLTKPKKEIELEHSPRRMPTYYNFSRPVGTYGAADRQTIILQYLSPLWGKIDIITKAIKSLQLQL